MLCVLTKTPGTDFNLLWEYSCKCRAVIFRVQKKSPRLSHSPLLEVNRTGSLLIVKSGSSNPHDDAHRSRRVPSGSPAAVKSPRTQTLCRFLPSLSTSAYSLSTEPATGTSLFFFQTFSPDLSPPPPIPSFPPPLCLFKCFLVPLALSPANCLHGYLCCI